MGAVFNKTIIPLALVGYEMIIANSALRTSLAIYHLVSKARSWNNIIVNYHITHLQEILQHQDAKQLVDESDLNENTPLHIAAMNGHALIVEVGFLTFTLFLVRKIEKIFVPIVK